MNSCVSLGGLPNWGSVCFLFMYQHIFLLLGNFFPIVLLMVWFILLTWYSFSSSMLTKRHGLLIVYCISCIFLSCIFNFGCIISSISPTLHLSHDVLSSVWFILLIMIFQVFETGYWVLQFHLHITLYSLRYFYLLVEYNF